MGTLVWICILADFGKQNHGNLDFSRDTDEDNGSDELKDQIQLSHDQLKINNISELSGSNDTPEPKQKQDSQYMTFILKLN